MLKIGIVKSDAGTESIILKTQKWLSEKAQTEVSISYFDTKKSLFNALTAGEIAFVPYKMASLPTQLPHGVVITALSERLTASYSLVILNKNSDNTQMLSLKTNAQVAVTDEVTQLQFQTFREDLNIKILEKSMPNELLEQLNNLEIDAFVCPNDVVQDMALSESEYTIITFNPKELIPAPATGVIAFLTAEDDIATRRILKAVHTPSVSAVTNIERRLKQLFEDKPVAAFCEIDRAFNYHFLAAAVVNGTLKKVRISQSTSFELAEKSFESLK